MFNSVKNSPEKNHLSSYFRTLERELTLSDYLSRVRIRNRDSALG